MIVMAEVIASPPFCINSAGILSAPRDFPPFIFCAKHNAKTGWVVIFICINGDVSINIYVVSCSMSCIMWLQRSAYTKYYAQCPAVINYYIIYIDQA